MQKHLKLFVLALPPVFLFIALYQSVWGIFLPSPQPQALTGQIEGTTQIRVFFYADKKSFALPKTETPRFINSLRIVGSKKSLLASSPTATFSFYRNAHLLGALWFVSDGSFRWPGHL